MRWVAWGYPGVVHDRHTVPVPKFDMLTESGVRLMTRLLTFSVLSVTHLIALPNASARTPTNIILIMADDVGWECFSSYGGQDYQTPRLDQLAADGIRFSHCYSQPLCTPSRVQIMTGKYNFRNYTHFGYLSPDQKTFGHRLGELGYTTAIAGKWQLNGLYHQAANHNDPLRPRKAGFDESMLWQVTQPKSKGERYWNPLIEHNGVILDPSQTDQKYGPDLFTDFVCDFIDRNKQRPFFVYYPMVLVHDPFVPTPKDTSDLDPVKPNRSPKSDAGRKKNFVAMVNYMDGLVGRIVDQTVQSGVADNTLIIFTADNGTNRAIRSRWNDRTVRGGKGTMPDAGTHVPMIAYRKGHTPTGVVVDDLIDFTDIYPTLVEVAGGTAGNPRSGEVESCDGRSFAPQLRGEPGHPRSWVLCHYHPHWGGNLPHGAFVRNSHHKRYRDGRAYDVKNDMDEINDLGDQSERWPESELFDNVLRSLPPVPPNLRNNESKDRPVYPNHNLYPQ